MIRPIVLYGDSMLKEISADIDKNSKLDIEPLIEDMFDTMHRAYGIGLAAVQISVPLRLFVIEAHIEEENFHFRQVFINPKILKEYGELVKHPEGCLSVPQLTAVVERLDKIDIEYYDEKWDHHVETYEGIKARIVQHEYDHLDGKLYVDRLDRMWRTMIDPSLDRIEDRDIEISYLWK